MSDESVARLLRSNEPLVVIEASAGCGKTFQGAAYARDLLDKLGMGRLLILTHTHAACGVFASRTRGAGSKVEIKTIDALIAQIATAYHQPLGLPRDVSCWAWQNDGEGFQLMATKVAEFLASRPMVARALAQRYPFIICDEHQDCDLDKDAIVMALHAGGAVVRIFGDPLQRIYGSPTNKGMRVDRQRWNALKRLGASDELKTPHRWKDGCPALGEWIMAARECLEEDRPIDLTGALPKSLQIRVGNNLALTRTGYQLSDAHRFPIDKLVRNSDQLMILVAQNPLVLSLRAFFNRSIPIWEGHTREALAALVTTLRAQTGNPLALAHGLANFMSSVAVGFTAVHSDRLLEEVRTNAAKPTIGKPANIQAIARLLLSDSSHKGVAAALDLIRHFMDTKAAGFEAIKIDLRNQVRQTILSCGIHEGF